MSDLHFEHGNKVTIYNLHMKNYEYHKWPEQGWPIKAPYLILAGNIGRINDDFEDIATFLGRRCAEYELVFLIARNNEFKNKESITHEQGVKLTRSLEKDGRMGGKLKFLECDRYDLKANGTCISILGCTLWSKIRDDQAKYIQRNTRSNLEGIIENNVTKHT
jgi:hypothetical protein